MTTHPVHVLGLATAVPAHVLEQEDVAAAAAGVFASRAALFERLRSAYVNAGIERRHSCVPLEWYLEPHGWPERTRIYLESAVELLEKVTRDCLARTGLAVDDIDAVVAVSTTGVATPSLDALLMERMGLRRDVTRLPIFGLGCAGGVLGLARASALARDMPGKRVLLLVIELCGLSFRLGDLSKSNIIATALFGDGAAAVLLSSTGEGPEITGWAEHTWPESLDVMGWDVKEDGLGVVFSRDIPAIVRERMRGVTVDALARMGLTLDDIDDFVCHPGGTKVIEALEEAFGLDCGALTETRAVLRDYGNMSSPTVLFVLDRVLSEASSGSRRHLLTALGPGFTAAFLTLETG